MGWRYRKSINLGLGFRVNLSKSGVGYSWGFPGYRTTKLANGGTRKTYSLPGTGISYVDQEGSGNKKRRKPVEIDPQLISGETSYFENQPIKDITKNDPILKQINKYRLFNTLSNILIIISLFVILHPAFSLCFLLGIITKIICKLFFNVKLYYEFDNETRKMYYALKEVWISFSQSRKLWQIKTSTRIFNTKYNANASNNVSRSTAFISNKLPSYIKSNLDIYGLNFQNQKIFFTPDRILVFRPFRKVFGCSYRDMFLGLKSKMFVETETVPKDATIVDYAWKYSNVDGSRDLRFNNNKRYPICKYGEFTLKTPRGIYTVIQFSNHDMATEIQSKIVLFGNQFNKILEHSKDKKWGVE